MVHELLLRAQYEETKFGEIYEIEQLLLNLCCCTCLHFKHGCCGTVGWGGVRMGWVGWLIFSISLVSYQRQTETRSRGTIPYSFQCTSRCTQPKFCTPLILDIPVGNTGKMSTLKQPDGEANPGPSHYKHTLLVATECRLEWDGMEWGGGG